MSRGNRAQGSGLREKGESSYCAKSILYKSEFSSFPWALRLAPCALSYDKSGIPDHMIRIARGLP